MDEDRLYHDPDLADFYDLENGWERSPDFAFCRALADGADDWGVGSPITDSSAVIDVTMKKISRKKTISTMAVISIRSSS